MIDFLKYGTPWCLSICGFGIAVLAMFAPIEGQDRVAAYGLAGSAIAGAAGLSQPANKGDVVRQAENVDVNFNDNNNE